MFPKNAYNLLDLNFSKFAITWEQRRLEKYFDERSERSSEGELISVTINSGVVKAIDLDRRDSSSEDKSNYKRVEKGDIAYNSMRMWQGASGYSAYSGILSPAYTVITPKEDVHSEFFAYMFKKHELIQTFQKNSQGLTSDTWNLKFPTLKRIKVYAPSYAEQVKIADVLNQLSHLITLHQRECDLLLKTKKSYLQKMFPKNGEDKPEIRFVGFNDAWEQCLLGNVAKITMGQSPNSENYTENPSDYILVQGNADMKEGRVVPRVWTTQVTKTADKGDLILSVRAPVGDIGKTDYDVVLGRGVAAIKGNEFLFQSLGKMKQNGYWTKLSTGSTFESINSNDTKEAQILLPSIEEQAKIGAFFSAIDTLLTLHQRELDSLKDMKKSLLQQMFI